MPKAVSPSITIKATVRHLESNRSEFLVRYRTVRGDMAETMIGREHFQDATSTVTQLLQRHALLPDDKKAAASLIMTAHRNRSRRNYDVTSRCGWRGRHFVYPTQTFGPRAKAVKFAGPCEINPVLGLKSGSINKFCSALREPCRHSDYLTFALSVPLAGPLLQLAGEEEGAVFHLHGVESSGRLPGTKTKSSSGKSLITRGGASIIGRAHGNDLVSFDLTTRSLEDLCFAHNDLAVFLDEEGRADGRRPGRVKPGHLAYQMASGRGTVRSNKATRDMDLANRTWKVMAISNGENPLDDPNGTPRPEGARVRMISVPVPPGDEGGVFNRVKGESFSRSQKCKKLAADVEAGIDENFGVVMPKFLQQLVKRPNKSAKFVRKIVTRFVRKVGADSSPYERRFARKFGIVAAAGMLAANFKLAPWDRKWAWRSAKNIYRTARAASVSVEQAVMQFLDALQQARKEGRFPRVKKGSRWSSTKKQKAWGAIQNIDRKGRAVLCPMETVRSIISPSSLTSSVLAHLANSSMLIKGADRKVTRQVMITPLTGTQRRRFVCIKLKAVERGT